VRVATIKHRPSGLTPAGNIESFAGMIDRAAAYAPDIVLLPETINLLHTGLSYVQAAEPIPGASTIRLGERARQHGIYIVAGLMERDGHAVYNTSVLINRQGEIVGKYRKVNLPIQEVEGGITPGDNFPVFDTDFGRVGMMICWDVSFTDPARALAAKGAELILMPIWGGDELLTRARAVENHLTVVTASYDSPTGIVDSRGEYIAIASWDAPVAFAEIDLDQSPSPLNPRAQFHAERRGDISTEP
jgi:predicted amidohydrolase